VKAIRALDETGIDSLVVAGGVGANRRLRARLAAETAAGGATRDFPRPPVCTDNGAMIAYAGMQRLLAGERDEPVIRARARWPLASLAPAGAVARAEEHPA
jgi:N6-L-threonylcarbamoyladenine synthase